MLGVLLYHALPYSIESVSLPDAHYFADRLPGQNQCCSCLHSCVALTSFYVGAGNLNSGPCG